VVGTAVRERLMRTGGIVVGHAGVQESAEMGLVQDDEMIQAFAANGADDPFDEGILPKRAGVVSTSRSSMLARRRVKASPYALSRSRRRYFGAVPSGKASMIWRVVQWAVG
jgi:hypothetical protein